MVFDSDQDHRRKTFLFERGEDVPGSGVEWPVGRELLSVSAVEQDDQRTRGLPFVVSLRQAD
jgi:hypothetical protein